MRSERRAQWATLRFRRLSFVPSSSSFAASDTHPVRTMLSKVQTARRAGYGASYDSCLYKNCAGRIISMPRRDRLITLLFLSPVSSASKSVTEVPNLAPAWPPATLVSVFSMPSLSNFPVIPHGYGLRPTGGSHGSFCGSNRGPRRKRRTDPPGHVGSSRCRKGEILCDAT